MSKANKLIREAGEQWEKEEIPKAIASLEEALELRPSARQQKEIRYTIGLLHLHVKHYELAKRRFQESVDNSYNISSSYNALGAIAKCEHHDEEAEAHFRNALRHDSKNVYALNNLANIAYDKGAYEEAQTLLERACTLDKTNATIRFNLIKALEKQQQAVPAALEMLYRELSLEEIYTIEHDKSLRYDLEDNPASTLSNTYLQAIQSKDPQHQRETLEHILEATTQAQRRTRKIKKGLGSLHARLGNAHVGLKEWEEAAAHYDAACALLGEKDSLCINRAVCHYNLGREEEAKRTFESIRKRKNTSRLMALCNLANMAVDEEVRSKLHLNEPAQYFQEVLEELAPEHFHKLDESRYEVSEAVVQDSNVNESYVFRRAPHSEETTNKFTNEGIALTRFHKENERQGYGLNIIRYMGFVENVQGQDIIVLARSSGTTLLDSLLQLQAEGKHSDIASLLGRLPMEMAKVRKVGLATCIDLTRQLHDASAARNEIIYKQRILDKFVGSVSVPGSVYAVAGARGAAVEKAIAEHYDAISSFFSGLPPDFYKDMSLKNVLLTNGEIEHLDFETLRNEPFPLEVATAFNMGNFALDKDMLIKQVYLANEDVGGASLGGLEEFVITTRAAGVQRGLIHHAGFVKWASSLGRPEYRRLARETMDNVLGDLAWLKDCAPVGKEQKARIGRIEDALQGIYT